MSHPGSEYGAIDSDAGATSGNARALASALGAVDSPADERAFLLIDGNNLLMRAMFAPGIGNAGLMSNGYPTGPLLVFINTVTKIVRKFQPHRIAIAWDGGRSEWRRALYPEYKATRKDSGPDDDLKDLHFKAAMMFCSLAHFVNLRQPGQEADDVIAAMWYDAEPSWCDRIVIVSSDKDFYQLIGESPQGIPTILARPVQQAEDGLQLCDTVTVEKNMGCLPEHVSAVRAIAGDSSDNIEGVRGIGPVKAVKALKKYGWDFGQTIGNTWPQDVSRLMTNYQIMDLRRATRWFHTERPPEWTVPEKGSPGYYELLVAFLRTYDLYTVLHRMDQGTLWRDLPSPSASAKEQATLF